MTHNKYEALVRQIAEEMAKHQYNEQAQNVAAVRPFIDQSEEVKGIWVKPVIPLARIAVKYMAEEARSAYSIGRDMVNDPYSRAGLTVTLKDRGLLPDSDKEAGKI